MNSLGSVHPNSSDIDLGVSMTTKYNRTTYYYIYTLLSSDFCIINGCTYYLHIVKLNCSKRSVWKKNWFISLVWNLNLSLRDHVLHDSCVSHELFMKYKPKFQIWCLATVYTLFSYKNRILIVVQNKRMCLGSLNFI